MSTSGEGNAKAAAVPPYLSYPTFQTFLSSLRAKGGAPGRIDRSVLVQFSGGVQAQLVSALRYLGLMSSDGIPTEDLDKLVKLEGDDRNKLWNLIMLRSYPYIFNDSFPLQTATSRMLEDKFNQVANGDTVRKCLSFFLLAARDAGVQLSPYIKVVKARRSNGGKARRTMSVASESTPEQPSQPQEARTPQDNGAQSWSQMLLSKFPTFDPTWPDDVKAKWFDAFDKLMKQG
jgi:hypothetical protein